MKECKFEDFKDINFNETQKDHFTTLYWMIKNYHTLQATLPPLIGISPTEYMNTKDIVRIYEELIRNGK